MKITLKEFIEKKQKELEQRYNKVELYDTPSVRLGNGITTHFEAEVTPRSREGREVTINEFPQNLSIQIKENGTEVIFNVMPKGKLEQIRLSYYFLWEISE